MKEVAVIGAGISGLSCASILDADQFKVTIFEKSRGKGGRASTRRSDGSQFDHGAQYISQTESPFQHVLDQWLESGIVEKWDANLGEISNSSFQANFEEEEVYVPVPKMSELANHLSNSIENVEFQYQTEIVSFFKKFNEWYLKDSEGEIYGGFEFLVLAIPAPQAIDLLEEYEYLVSILDRVEYGPRWAVMLVFDQPVEVEFDGTFLAKSPIRWACRNNSKPGRSSEECWIIHANQEWSAKHIRETPEWVAEELLDEFLNVSGEEDIKIKHKQAHLWRYAIVNTPLNQNFLLDNNRNIGLIGDYCLGKNIEAAYRSGEELGLRLNSLRI